MIYWDTSALLKAYNVDEKLHARAMNLRKARLRHVSSALLRVELLGAICSRLLRNKALMRTMVADALEELKGWTLLGIDPHVEPAGLLCERYGLRGADSLHLASALTFRREVSRKFRFASADQAQLLAAKTEGLKVIDLG